MITSLICIKTYELFEWMLQRIITKEIIEFVKYPIRILKFVYLHFLFGVVEVSKASRLSAQQVAMLR